MSYDVDDVAQSGSSADLGYAPIEKKKRNYPQAPPGMYEAYCTEAIIRQFAKFKKPNEMEPKLSLRWELKKNIKSQKPATYIDEENSETRNYSIFSNPLRLSINSGGGEYSPAALYTTYKELTGLEPVLEPVAGLDEPVFMYKVMKNMKADLTVKHVEKKDGTMKAVIDSYSCDEETQAQNRVLCTPAQLGEEPTKPNNKAIVAPAVKKKKKPVEEEDPDDSDEAEETMKKLKKDHDKKLKDIPDEWNE